MAAAFRLSLSLSCPSYHPLSVPLYEDSGSVLSHIRCFWLTLRRAPPLLPRPWRKVQKSSVESIPTEAAHTRRIIGSCNSFRAMAGWKAGLNPVALRGKHTLKRFLFAFVNCEITILPVEEALLVRAFLSLHTVVHGLWGPLFPVSLWG